MLRTPQKINLLPEHLIDQIKAGEVIERPGNLIKEILENAIDASPTRVELTLKNNGLDLINLKDDGHGIYSKDLALAFSRHATSKIARFEDLYQLHSFGFRGEALASIAAISKVQCLSYTDTENEGAEIRIDGGFTTYEGRRIKNPGQRGTELNIQDLFYNTPVRLKFVQSQQSEKNFLKKIIFSFILAHPQIEFVIKMNEEEREVYPARENLSSRLIDVIPKCKDLLLFSKRSYEENDVEIYLIPGNLKAPTKFQYAFINQRFILDKQIHRVISNALMSSFGMDDFHFIALINLPSDHIDVNVHPNKTVIKLFETSKIIGLISGTIKELAQHENPTKPHSISSDKLHQNSFNEVAHSEPILGQERQAYNMEGIFSPHHLPLDGDKNFIWLGNFILTLIDNKWEVMSANKLLHEYVQDKLHLPFTSVIPLLVSEPFKINPDLSRIKELNSFGLELEKLSRDTIVLRAIPDWMNGLPLKEIVAKLIKNESIENLHFDPKEWAQSTWQEMAQHFGIEKLREKKISLDMKSLLEREFK